MNLIQSLPFQTTPPPPTVCGPEDGRYAVLRQDGTSTNSSQRRRWLAAALLAIEPRLRRVKGYQHVPRLREALQRDLKINLAAPTKVA